MIHLCMECTDEVLCLLGMFHTGRESLWMGKVVQESGWGLVAWELVLVVVCRMGDKFHLQMGLEVVRFQLGMFHWGMVFCLWDTSGRV